MECSAPSHWRNWLCGVEPVRKGLKEKGLRGRIWCEEKFGKEDKEKLTKKNPNSFKEDKAAFRKGTEGLDFFEKGFLQYFALTWMHPENLEGVCYLGVDVSGIECRENRMSLRGQPPPLWCAHAVNEKKKTDKNRKEKKKKSKEILQEHTV